MKPNIKDLSLQEFEAHLAGAKEPSYRAKQIWQWLFQKRAASFAEMTNLSASLRGSLAQDFTISRLTILRQEVSTDGTKKFLFGLSDGHSIESVLIPEEKRLTLCVSTQAGCGFGCTFCATAVLGLKRNLQASEILDQILDASRSLARDQRITHVVLMGMGEPLANYAQTVTALKVMTDTSWGIGISPRRITLSTVGLVPQIQKLMEETKVNLAISLHAPTDELRDQLMPVNRKYSLQELMECCRALALPSNMSYFAASTILSMPRRRFASFYAASAARLILSLSTRIRVVGIRDPMMPRSIGFSGSCRRTVCKSISAAPEGMTSRRPADNCKGKSFSKDNSQPQWRPPRSSNHG